LDALTLHRDTSFLLSAETGRPSLALLGTSTRPGLYAGWFHEGGLGGMKAVLSLAEENTASRLESAGHFHAS
jgi:hypothetical protein